MKRAVIELFGKQYLVSEGETILVSVPNHSEENLTVPVLTLNASGALQVGTPHVPNAHAEIRMGKPFRGKKIIVETYKAKSHYHRRRGYRPLLASIKIEKIITKSS